jgi:hypothetical protein
MTRSTVDAPIIEKIGDYEVPDGVIIYQAPSKVGNWYLVTIPDKVYQVSVAPDGLISLDRALRPADWDDFVAVGAVAAQVGREIIAINAEKAKGDDRSLPSSRIIVREGPPPPGALRMLATPGPNQPPRRPQVGRATIGRPKRKRPIAPPGAQV